MRRNSAECGSDKKKCRSIRVLHNNISVGYISEHLIRPRGKKKSSLSCMTFLVLYDSRGSFGSLAQRNGFEYDLLVMSHNRKENAYAALEQVK